MGDVTELAKRRCDVSARLERARDKLVDTLERLRLAGLLTTKEADDVKAAIERSAESYRLSDDQYMKVLPRDPVVALKSMRPDQRAETWPLNYA